MKNIFNITVLLAFILIACEDGGQSDKLSPGNGKGGSMARFALGSNHLYIVNNTSVIVFAMNENGALEKGNTVDAGFGIETIFIRGNNLFLGANDAMYIFDISDPGSPLFISRYTHIYSCDPVVTEGTYAYVSLRTREGCHFQTNDVLEIININDLANPILVKEYPATTPYGLGVDGNILFLCRGDNGVTIYNAADPLDMTVIKSYPDVHAYDVIPNNGVFIMTGNDGIYQYSYAQPSDIQLLSHIQVR
jgi:hypothetical protein